MSDARKCRLFHRWQPVGISDRFAPRATGRDGRAVRDRPTCSCGLVGDARKRTQTEHITAAVIEKYDHD